jgi:hypothetical protein
VREAARLLACGGPSRAGGVHRAVRDRAIRPDANCSSFHLRMFLGLLNPQEQRFDERKTKFNLEMSRTTQMQLYKCIHVP